MNPDSPTFEIGDVVQWRDIRINVDGYCPVGDTVTVTDFRRSAASGIPMLCYENSEGRRVGWVFAKRFEKVAGPW